MDKINTCLALDFYGKLLTDKMREIMEFYYFDDLSLAEIADDVGITRQAVHDTVRRAGVLLEEYEDKLGLIRRFRKEKNEIEEAIRLLDKDDKDGALMILKAVREELITE
ncbi:MAG: YlxM family DNA-binding protein [Clostridiales bacterium]|nr:YlxM family DNA-binding protein [Clostridiales bacterium]